MTVSPSSQRGSTLVEALVATLIVATGVLAMAQLLSMAATSGAASRVTTVATILAEQKLEQLRASVWDLAPSPASLEQNTPGYVDHIDAHGRVAGDGTTPPAAAAYTRRWSIAPLPADPNAVLVQVHVSRRTSAGDRRGSRRAEGARLVTLVVRTQ
jgi:type II secretory pathway pseudopilin PulG